MTICRIFHWRAAVSLTGLAVLGLFLAGCHSKETDKLPAAAVTNRAAPTEVESSTILSAGDAAMLKGGAANKASTEAERAWEELAKALQSPPEEPAEWQLKEPTKEEIAKFEKTNSVLAAGIAAKARDFYTRFPNDERAAEARKQEMALLGAAVQLGNTNAIEPLRQLEEARLKDPNLSEDDRLELRMQQLQRSSAGSKDTNTVATLTQMEKAARTLQKEFPKRSEVTGLLLSVAEGWAENNEPEKSRAIAREVAESASDEDVKTGAQELLKKIDRIGKPLELKFKAVDGRAVDLQDMRGKVVLVDFWATWCGPCMMELPNVKAAYEELHPQGFEIIGISFDREQSALEKVVAREKMAWPQHYDDSEEGKKFGDQFGISSIPTMWLVDKKGVLRDLNARQGLADKVKKLLAEK